MVDGNAGKGDKYRKVDPKKYSENWEKAFPKDKKSKVLLDKASVMEAGGIIDKSGIKKPIKVRETFHPNVDKPKDKKKKGNIK
tara:strand:- start:415 stop:663 length:249 start_codon:yes stop_codon:yes gene_type:complete